MSKVVYMAETPRYVVERFDPYDEDWGPWKGFTLLSDAKSSAKRLAFGNPESSWRVVDTKASDE